MPDRVEAAVVRLIIGLAEDGLNDAEIAAELNRLHLRPRRARVWGVGTVRRVRVSGQLRAAEEELRALRAELVRRVAGVP